MAGICKIRLKRANGKVVTKYRIAYRDIYGKQHTSKLYDTKEAAKKDLYKYEKVNPDTFNITIGQMCHYYMEYANAQHSNTTVLDTKYYMDNHFYKLFNIKHEKITSIDLERFINNIAKERTPSVANQALKKIKAVEGYCYRHRLIKERKFNIVEQVPYVEKKHFSLESDELIEVINACNEIRPKYFAMIYTGIATGVRIGELSALTVNDVHFEKDITYIHICKQFTKGKLLPHTKTKDIRDVSIFEDLADVLKAHIAKLPKNTKLLFPNKAGNYYNPSNLRNRVWKPLLAYVGITKEVRIHDLRGSYINLTLSSGLSVKFTQEQVGHKEARTTLNVYASCNNDMKKKAMKVLNETFSQRKHM